MDHFLSNVCGSFFEHFKPNLLSINYSISKFLKLFTRLTKGDTGADPEILKRGWGWGALYVGHHGWPTKKVLGFRWSKKAKITLETIAFGEIFLSPFSSFLHLYNIMKA